MSTVSAIISAYHSEKFLQDRILNLLMQDLVPEIVIVCQRNSPEHDYLAGNEFSKLLRVIITEDIPNVYTAWNLGIGASTGEYITNANTDDIFYANGIRTLAYKLDDGYSVAFSDVDVRTDKGIHAWKRIVRYDVETLKVRSYIGPMPMWRKSLHDKYGLFDDSYQVAGDWEFFLRCATNGEPFFYYPHALGMYWKRDDSIEHRNKELCKQESIRVRNKYQ